MHSLYDTSDKSLLGLIMALTSVILMLLYLKNAKDLRRKLL